MTSERRVRGKDLSTEDALRLGDLRLRLKDAREPGALAHGTCRGLRRLLGADGVTFVLSEGEQVYYAEEDAAGQLWKGRRFPASACISGWAIAHREAAVIEDITVDPRIPLDAYLPTFVKSLLMVPVGEDPPLGALGIYWAERHTATAREMFMARAVAQTVHEQLLAARLGRVQRPEFRTVDGQTAGRVGQRPDLRMLSVIAHDLRNPLSAIMQTADIIRLRKGRAEADDLDRIQRSAERATQMVEQLYSYTRLQQSLRLSLTHTPVDEVCRQAVAEVTAAHPDCDIRLEVQPTTALLDADRLSAVAVNLVRNAVQHGDRRRPIRMRVAEQADEIRIEVHNHGRPIPSTLLPRLFAPFVKEGGAREAGLGLGLFITHQVVAAHGGRVDVRSTAEQGTTFSIRLPLGATVLDVG